MHGGKRARVPRPEEGAEEWSISLRHGRASSQPSLTGTCEVRLADRDPGYATADTLLLREWDPVCQAYTGADQRVLVTHILWGEDPLSPIRFRARALGSPPVAVMSSPASAVSRCGHGRTR